MNPLAYLFSIHDPEPRKYLAVALVLLSACLKMWLSSRTPLRWFSAYLVCATAASILQRSPLWSLWAEIAMAIMAGFTVWEGITRIKWREHQWFGFFVGVGLFAALLWIEPKPYPMFSQTIYYVKLFGATFLFATCIGAEACVWSDGIAVHAHNLLLAAWFLIKALACFKWSDQYPALDVWWVLAISTAAQIGCLLFWIALTARTSSQYSSSGSPVGEYPESDAPRDVLP